jgi:hypothetical protein
LVVYAQLDRNRVAEWMAKDGYRRAEYYISVAPVKYGTGLYGDTAMPAGDMNRFVAAEGLFAMRSFQTGGWHRRRHRPRLGPLAAEQRVDRSVPRVVGGILERVARSIGRSFEEAACGEGGAECRWEVDGASFSEAWASIARSS